MTDNFKEIILNMVTRGNVTRTVSNVVIINLDNCRYHENQQAIVKFYISLNSGKDVDKNLTEIVVHEIRNHIRAGKTLGKLKVSLIIFVLCYFSFPVCRSTRM